MFEKNARVILQSLDENDLVLDIGGGMCPFNRANYIIDIVPYENRAEFGFTGGYREYFTKETWIKRNICFREPFPFNDNQFDYVVCSHILEDIRDPVFVCSENNRIGKGGYIEVPSRIAEISLGTQSRHYAGYCHHRWIIEIDNDQIVFFPKLHFVYSNWKYHLPSSYGRNMPTDEKFQYMFWRGEFQYEEEIRVDSDGMHDYLEEIVLTQHAYPA